MSKEQTDELSHEGKVVTWCLGYLHELKEKGMVEGPDMLTPEGWAEFISLKAQGFRPRDSEIRDCINYLKKPH